MFAAKQVITFTQKLEDLDANEKDTMATFECETNEPFVRVKWLKNNVEIFSGDKYRMHSDRKVHFLSVLMIDMRDDAEFTCMVVDDEVRTTAKLNVEGESAILTTFRRFLSLLSSAVPLLQSQTKIQH